MGGCSIDAHGTALTDEVLDACRAADAVLLGAVGGPKWDTTDPDAPRPEQGLLGLRKGMGLYANLRPVRPSPALVGASPLREERIAGTDLLVVRELTGGIYFGDSGRDGDVAHDTCEYSAAEIERIARVGFEAARRRADGSGRKPRVTSVDKANVLETSRLWREVVGRRRPRLPRRRARPPAGRQRRDAARLAPGRLRRDRHREPLRRHPQRRVGDAHRLAGDAALGQPRRRRRARASSSRSTARPPTSPARAIANPLATFLSAAMMLRHGLDRADDAARIEAAVDAVLERGLRTPDLAAGRSRPPPMTDVPHEVEVGTAEMTAAVLEELTAERALRGGHRPLAVGEKSPAGFRRLASRPKPSRVLFCGGQGRRRQVRLPVM